MDFIEGEEEEEEEAIKELWRGLDFLHEATVVLLCNMQY